MMIIASHFINKQGAHKEIAQRRNLTVMRFVLYLQSAVEHLYSYRRAERTGAVVTEQLCGI